MTTVSEKLAALREWLDDDTRRPDVEWEARGMERVRRLIASLEAWDPGMLLVTTEQAAYGSHEWLSEVDRWAIKWQHRDQLSGLLSTFEVKLLDLVEVSDDVNLAKLYDAYPDLVTMIRQWRESDLAERLRGLPFAFEL